MATRTDEQQQRQRETSEPGTRHHHLAKASPKASSSAAAPVSQDALAQPIIIECRKKNSKQESVVTHRFHKGKLLGKVWVYREREQGERETCESCLFFGKQAQEKWATAKSGGKAVCFEPRALAGLQAYRHRVTAFGRSSHHCVSTLLGASLLRQYTY